MFVCRACHFAVFAVPAACAVPPTLVTQRPPRVAEGTPVALVCCIDCSAEGFGVGVPSYDSAAHVAPDCSVELRHRLAFEDYTD